MISKICRIDRKIKNLRLNQLTLKKLVKNKYDVVIVFGCGKINENIIRDYNNKIKIHRGLKISWIR